NGQSDNVGDNKTPSDADGADAQEGISKLDSAQAGLRFEAAPQMCPQATFDLVVDLPNALPG
ncbi:MAG: hypothetical protein WAN79_12670, partial [Opitutaceae bacterium]